MQLHPLAHTREAERLVKMARMASAEMDERAAARYRWLAKLMMMKGAN